MVAHICRGAPHYDRCIALFALSISAFLCRPKLDPIFLKLARTIAELYPKRVREPILAINMRREIIVLEFNDDARTTQDQVLRVLAVAAQVQPKR